MYMASKIWNSHRDKMLEDWNVDNYKKVPFISLDFGSIPGNQKQR